MNRILREPYRTEEEVEHWRERDPITLHTAWLKDQGVATAEEIEAVWADVNCAIDGALEFARESPYPDASDLFTDMYADPIPIR